MAKPLGQTQRAIIRCLHQYGEWHEGCEWYWDSVSNTRRIMEGLVKRGSVVREDTSFKGTYFSGTRSVYKLSEQP